MKKAIASDGRMQDARTPLQAAVRTGPAAHSLPDAPARERTGVLRALCRLEAPWAFWAGRRLAGLDVLAVERYAALTGREVAWCICDASEIPRLLESGEAELAVGGLPESIACEGGLARALASWRKVARRADEGASRERHVWVIGALGTAERWRLKAFLLWQRLHGFARR